MTSTLPHSVMCLQSAAVKGALLKDLDYLLCGEAHGAQHGDLLRVCRLATLLRCCGRRAAGRWKGLIEVGVLHVREHPLHCSLGASILQQGIPVRALHARVCSLDAVLQNDCLKEPKLPLHCSIYASALHWGWKHLPDCSQMASTSVVEMAPCLLLLHAGEHFSEKHIVPLMMCLCLLVLQGDCCISR